MPSKESGSSPPVLSCNASSPWQTGIILTHQPSPLVMPQELLAFQPQERDTHKLFSKGAVIRQIFMHQPLSEDEQTYLREWRVFTKENNFSYPPQAEHMILRLLYYSKRKFKEKYLQKTMEHMTHIVTWRQSYFPIKEEDVLPDLQSGLMYWMGRDSSLRPLLIVRLANSSKSCTPAQVSKVCIFCMEYIIKYGMFPGKNENCRVLVDLKGVPIHKIPLTALKEMAALLTKQYPFRLDRMYILNSPRVVQSLWSVIKTSGVLSEVQMEKINFYRSNFAEALLAEYAPHQLEECYGGSVPNITKFYPFPFQPGPFEPFCMEGPRKDYKEDVWKVLSDTGRDGVIWENEKRTPYLYSLSAPGIFKKCGVPFSVAETRQASAVRSLSLGKAKDATAQRSADQSKSHDPRMKDSELRSLLDSPSATGRLLPQTKRAQTRISLLNNEITEPIDVETGKPLHVHNQGKQQSPVVDEVTVYDAWEGQEQHVPVESDVILSPRVDEEELVVNEQAANVLCGGTCSRCVLQ
eukprot:GHVL01005211.1.p1 GENE.GHVL01005211.1~~GHVL01005211.1.p1  ORF type:complete len:522 (+),score=91.75 GHVL01005211.1:447-2012(+)